MNTLEWFNIKSPFDFIDIVMNGVAGRARPVEWHGEHWNNGLQKDGTPIIPILFHTTCPKTAELLEIKSEEILKLDGVLYYGEIPDSVLAELDIPELLEAKPDAVKLDGVLYPNGIPDSVLSDGDVPYMPGEDVEDIEPGDDSTSMFIDPVEAGILDLNVELLKVVHS